MQSEKIPEERKINVSYCPLSVSGQNQVCQGRRSHANLEPVDYSEPEGAVLGRGKDIGSEREPAATVLHGQGDGERVCSVPVPRGRRHGDPVHDPGKLSAPR